jgi:addiction module RelE/StbE family toxin
MYRSQFTDDALEELRRLPKNVRNRLKQEFIRKIHRDPAGCSEPLTGLLEGFRSFHFKEYHVIYRVFEDLKVIAVAGIGKKDAGRRAEVYEQLENLARTGRLAAAVLEVYQSLGTRLPRKE